MIKGALCMLFFSGWYAGIDAQVTGPVTISGQIKTDRDSVKLLVWFYRDPVLRYGNVTDGEKIQVPVTADGRFSITTPSINHLARLYIADGVSHSELFTHEQQIIAPGDKITLLVNIRNQGNPDDCKVSFSGKGATKYTCIQSLKTIELDILDTNRDTRHTIHLYDSLLNHKQKILNSFESKLAKEEYALIKADMISELRDHALMNACGYNFGSIHAPKPGADELAQKKKIFDKLVSHFTSYDENNNSIAYSINYRKYLYLKAKAELVFENNGVPVRMGQLFKKLSSEYNGLLRDKLLAALLLDTTENYYFFGGIDPDEQLQCLQESVLIIQSGELKDRIKKSLKGQVKGSPAFDFTLPLDSSDTKKVSLSDLKGKVVLLDLWSYQCTGCFMYANAFHKKIYPAFQNNPEFVVVSIMLDESSREGYMRRLRREGGVAYTFPEYINLFGGKGIASAREMQDYYNIEGFPTVMLIDKQGKIYSSTLPVFYGDPRNKELENNIKKMVDLIQKALAEPGTQKTIL